MSRHDEQRSSLLSGSALAALWPEGAPDDARAFLDRNPHLRGDKGAALDLAYDEYCRRVEAGEVIDLDAFCDRFPTFQSSLREVIQAHEYLAANPALIEDREPTPWPVEGETFLGFRLLRELGRGSFARVFLAAEPDLGDRLVAVKISPHGGAEAQTLGRLDHPNVVPVHAVRHDERSGLTAVCMPYLGGATLENVLAAFVPAGRPGRARAILDAARSNLGPAVPGGEWLAPAPLLETAPYAEGVGLLGAQLAEALAFLHDRAVYHRDLKPSNVLLCPDGRPMLLDFNLSADPHAGRERLGGTLPYMSPEQVLATFVPGRAGAPVDARSDLFSLGVILFELLTGRQPFGPVPRGKPSPEDCASLLARQEQGAPPVRRLCPEASPALARVIESCLAFDRERRPRNAAEVAAALRRDLAPPRRILRRLLRHPRKLAAAVLAGALVFGGAAYVVAGPPYTQRMLDESRAAYAVGDNERALDRAERVLARAPKSAEAHFLRGRVYQRQRQFDRAVDDYLEANRLAPDAQVSACIAYCLSLSGNHAGAISYYEEAIANGFEKAEVYNNLAYSQMKSARRDKAEKNLERALALAPDLPALHHNRLVLIKLGLRLGKKDRLPQARPVLREALAACPESAELRGDAAALCAAAANLEAGWDDEALTQLEKAGALGLPLASLLADPMYDCLRTHPRFRALPLAPPNPRPPQPTRCLVDPLGDEAQSP